jgi:hypothetical protein
MTEEEYILHLLKLKKNNENECIRQTIIHNQLIYPIEDNFDSLFKGLIQRKTTGGVYLENENILKRADEVYCYLKMKNYKDIKKISPNDYIRINRIDNSIIEKSGLNYDEKGNKRNRVLIMGYQLVNYFETGQTFGEVALNSPNAKRTATIISSEKCYLAVIQSKDYDELLKDAVETSKKIFFNLIYSYKIFNTISKYVFTKRYYQFFIYKKCEKDAYLIEENKKCENVYFIFNGEFEITLTGNLVDVNNLIIFYKKLIKKIRKNINDKFLDYKEEEKENDDLILNKNFKTIEENKILLEKKKIKLDIFDTRQIIGLRNIYDLSNLNFIKDLLSCQNL